MGVEFLTLLYTKSLQKIIDNYFCASIIFKNSLKTGFNKKFTFTICVGRVWVIIGYFLLEKQTFNGLLKVIGIQIVFLLNLKVNFISRHLPLTIKV